MQLTMEQIAQYAAKAWGIVIPVPDSPDGGFQTSGGQDLRDVLVTAVAIAWAESGGETSAHNAIWPDDSYGLWQINMRGSLGPARRRQFGLKADVELLDPQTNANAAHAIWLGNGRSFKAWSTYTNRKYVSNVPAARRAIGNMKGDSSNPFDLEPVVTGLLDSIFGFFKEGALRVGGFIGGAGLIVMAVVLVSKKGIK